MIFLRTILMTALLIAASFTASAQKALDRTTEATCDCLEEKKVSRMKTEEAKQALQACIVEAMMPNLEGLMDEMGLKTLNEETGYKIGIEIGKKLLVKCPDFLDMSVKMAEEKNPGLLSGDSDTPAASYTAEGRIVRVETNEFVSFIIEGSDGRETKYLWTSYFTGSEKFESDPSKYAGKKVSFSYQEVEMYLPKAKGYYKVKTLTSISVAE